MSDLHMLPAWLDTGAATLAGAVPSAPTLAGALPGLNQALQLNPLQCLQRVQESGLTRCGFSGEPIYLAWRQFLRGHDSPVLVIDATSLDARARASETVLNSAPWLLAEGLLIAAGLRPGHQARKVELCLPAELTGQEAKFLNALDAIRQKGFSGGRRLQVEVVRNSRPSCLSDGHATDSERLVHTPETWCRIALLFAGQDVAALDAGLLTLRRGLKQRGLIEVKRNDMLRRLIYDWGGGVEVEGRDAILVFDNGMGGFLPLSEADLSCRPLTLAAAGVVPAPTSLMMLAEGVCLVEQTRRALYRYWQLADNEPPPVRTLLARVARLVAEVTVGHGLPAHLAELDELAIELATQGLAAAWPLGTALRYFRAQWEDHVRLPQASRSCSEGLCQLTGGRNAAPCHSTCPANIDIPSFMAHIGHGDARAAISVITRDNPFPLTCGLVCPAPCESACVRNGSNGAVFIRPMKAWAAERCLAEGGYPQPELAPPSGKKIGVVGSGPAGLSAAYYLRLLGHAPEVFEGQAEAGGMLRYGIPAYRMPPDLLDKEIAQIAALGIPIHCSAKVASLDAFRKDYDAVFLGLGTQTSRLVPVEGIHQPFVLGGIDFLRNVRSGMEVQVGPRVIVIGGGNVAIDVALTAVRQGAKQVDMVCLEKRREMPASHHEIEQCVAEGVKLHPGWGPVSIGEEGDMTFQQCLQVFDDQHRFSPKFDSERKLKIEADHIIFAVGQGTDLTSIEGSGLEVTRGFIVTDPRSLMTKLAGVFAGGDVAHGPRTAVEAIRSGKIAAYAIHAWLTGTIMDPAVGKPQRRAEVIPLTVVPRERSYLHRAEMPEKDIEERLGDGNYAKVELGLSDGMAHGEASRCLRCDVCIGCGLCQLACSEMGVEALRMADTSAGRLAYFDFTRPVELCIGCGACAQVCPTGAIRIEDADGVRRTIITGTVVREQPLAKCRSCGALYQTVAHRNFVHDRMLSYHMEVHLDRHLCPDCARQLADRPCALQTAAMF
jgi:NADPH-dependent glutamate synthase beta subunit-like oxidoreductase/NADH:ubiquinone oxidoreductase subunit F (NADH-binding)/formate hydrogenlyase subunit 6/NADH:ubiquinone oxidoreductase subunit I